MSQYIVSARKYRPDSFEDLIGQDNISRTLSNSIKRGQLAHAYLFCGPRGVGKTTTARIFAKMINCSNPGPNMEPCGECESCTSFVEGRSFCIHEMDAASNNSVDAMRALLEKVIVPPPVGKYSVYIIDEVHMLSSSAFNAFLKTLEEPPAHAIFILATTEKHKILPTILSRCQTYDFNRISVADIVRNLKDIAEKEGIKIDDESLHVIATKGDGSMRDALTIFDQTVAFCGEDVKYADVIKNLNVLDYEYSFSLVDSFLNGDFSSPMRVFDEVLAKGFNAVYFVSSLSSHLRNLAVALCGGLDALIEMPDSLKQRLNEQAARCTMDFIYEALGITSSCEAGYKTAVNPRLHIEYTLMRLAYIVRRAAPRQLPAAPAVSTAPAQASPATPSASPTVPSAAPAPVAPTAPAQAAPVASPAPASPAETPAAPAPRRARKTGASLSLNSMMNVQRAEEKIAEEKAIASAAPEDSAIIKVWESLPAEYSENMPRLSAMLGSAKYNISLEDDIKVLSFEVANESQKKWLDNKILSDLEGKMRKTLNSGKVRMNVTVQVDDTPRERAPYLPEEKAKDLATKNPEVGNLISELSLDINTKV